MLTFFVSAVSCVIKTNIFFKEERHIKIRLTLLTSSLFGVFGLISFAAHVLRTYVTWANDFKAFHFLFLNALLLVIFAFFFDCWICIMSSMNTGTRAYLYRPL